MFGYTKKGHTRFILAVGGMALEGKFEIADLSPDEVRAIERAEEAVKAETGRDIILIAWDNSLASGQSADNKAKKS